ncbi:MAG: acido-empty-quinoprotein group A [Pseudomonadota bacterium]
MTSRIVRLAAAMLTCLAAAASLAQANLDPAAIGTTPVDAWTTYNGDHSGRHYSTLKQINQANVRNLGLAWSYRANFSIAGAQTGGSVDKALPVTLSAGALAGGRIKATPLFVDGVLYFSAPDNVWAIDARTGVEIWHFQWRTAGGEYIGNRGVAMYRDSIYFGTPDGHVVALDASTGRERWHKQIGSVKDNYFSSASPVIVKNHLILGLSGDALDVPGWLESRNPDTGELEWKWSTTPEPGTPEASTWPSVDAMRHGGGMTWQPVTYDQSLNLIYVATGNPNPMYVPERRQGDNLFSCSVVALNPDTGKLVWYYQTSANEAWDFDTNQVPVLIDGHRGGKPRKLLAQIARNGMYFLLDRATGEHLLSTQVAESVNWSLGFDDKGRPIRNPAKLNQAGGALISPSNGGIQNWTPPAFMPETGLLYFNAPQGFDIHYTYGPPDASGGLGHRAQAVGGFDMSLRALDYQTGELRWIHRYAGSEWDPPRPHLVGGLLATAGRLVFAGAPAGGPGGFVVAYDPEMGRQLWHATLPMRMSNTPITYMMDGDQYVLFAADDTMYAYKLPR